MNRLTQVLDEEPADCIGYAWLEKELFGNTQTDWFDIYDDLCFHPDLYEILILFCSLIAQWTEEELEEYVQSYLQKRS